MLLCPLQKKNCVRKRLAETLRNKLLSGKRVGFYETTCNVSVLYCILSRMTQSLCSPGPGADSRCVRSPNVLGPVRGAFADARARLCPLVNIGYVVIRLMGMVSLVLHTARWR